MTPAGLPWCKLLAEGEIRVKFSMEADVLSVMGQKTATQSDDLGDMVRRLLAAAEPLQGKFNGAAKAAFNNFKARTDEVADSLNAALAGIGVSIGEQNKAFVTADTEGSDLHRTAAGSADFAGADVSRFAGRG